MAKLALLGGEAECRRAWPDWPVWGDEERAGLLGVLESGKWWYGPRVAEFEAKFAAFQDARFGVTTSSGTTALETCLRALRVGAGDEVVVPAYTFIATASAVVNVGARPVFADVLPDTLCMDPADAERKLTPRTRAIMPVHLAGHVADMDALVRLARRHDVRVVEDACHSWGSKWNGKGTGAIGDCGVFSFQASKNLSSAEGGIVLTDDQRLADVCRSLTNCGRLTGAQWYEHGMVGGNVRMTEFQAALLLAQFTRLEGHMETRRRSALILNEALRAIPGVRPFDDDPRVTRRAYHLYCFEVDEHRLGISRQRFLDALAAEGVPASGGYLMPVYRNACFQPPADGRAAPGDEFRPRRGDPLDFSAVHCPVAERVCREVCWLTHAMLLADEDVIRAAARAIAKVVENAHELTRPKLELHAKSRKRAPATAAKRG
jgi:dTDP-4-amino-4,6-dideoxygalactose transaminase